MIYITVVLHVQALKVRVYSFSTTSKDVRVTKQESEYIISGFVTCSFDREWWLACVLEVDTENLEVKVSFLHPYGPARSFRYPSAPDIRIISATDILTKVTPRTAKGHVYS